MRQRLESEPERLDHGPIAVLHAVMDSVVDNYLVVDREVRRDLEQIEEQVFASDTGGDANTIYRLKREVLEFRRATQPLADALPSYLERTRAHGLPDAILPFFRDVADHLRLVNDHVESYDRLLTDVLSAHLASVSVQAERRHAPDLRLGRDRGGADDDRRHLRHELRVHARADRQRPPRRRRVQVRLLRRAARHGLRHASGSTAPFKRSGWL